MVIGEEQIHHLIATLDTGLDRCKDIKFDLGTVDRGVIENATFSVLREGLTAER